MTEKQRRRSLIALMALTFLVLVVYMYVKYDSQDTIRIGIYTGSSWDVPGTDQYALFDKAIEKFQTRYPNIKVVYEEGISVDDYSEWLAHEILNGQEPDIYLILPDDFSTLVGIRALKNLNGTILKDMSFDKDVFYESTYTAGERNGIQYALPFTCNPRMMFVNISLMNEAGVDMPAEDWSWKDFLKLCRRMTKDTDGDGILDQFGYYDYSWQDAAYANRAEPFDEDGTESYFTSEAMMEALSFTKELQEVNQGQRVTSDDFDLGHVAYRPMTFAEYRTYMPYPWRIKKYSTFDWNATSMPAGDQGENISTMNTLLLGMSSRTNNPEMAWEFMKMMTTDSEIQTAIYEYTAGASPVKDVTRSDEVAVLLNEDTPGDVDIDMSLLDRIIEDAVVPKEFANYDTVFQYADHYIKEALEEDEEMNISMSGLNKELRQLLNR